MDLSNLVQRAIEDGLPSFRPGGRVVLPPISDSRKRILVTGGAGFLGSHLIDRLLGQGHEVICVDNLFSSTKRNIDHLHANPRFEFLRHDVCFPLYVEVDEIYNLACPASPIHYQHDPIQTLKTSVHGAINMLGLAKRLKCKILQASTSEVYGDPVTHPQTEEYWGNVNPIGPRACYDEGKRAAETLFFDYHRQARRADQGGAHLQHLRPAHAPPGRPRGLELHRPGAARPADHHLWRRQPDALLLLCRRPDRRADEADGEPGRGDRPDQHRQHARVHHPGTGRRWSSRSPARAPRSSGSRCPATIRTSASRTSPRRARCSAGSRRCRCARGSTRTVAYFRELLADEIKAGHRQTCGSAGQFASKPVASRYSI